ncbi:DMT family transporter [Fodinicurvata sp. EGI_FJ10296]|uniref:DMT family transporter n=1 Tax=Fodinicurvata sp. EGI_FJ10296 TaxID=3231908 RepID=UPI003451417F
MADSTAYVLLVLSAAFMGSNIVFGRAAADVVPPIALAFWRWVVAAMLLLPFCAAGLLRHRAELLHHWRRLFALGALGMAICGTFVYIGLRETTAMNGGLIYAASPVMILILGAAFKGERITLRQIAGIVLALLGVVTILTRGNLQAVLALSFNRGDLWILGATASWAVYSVMLRYASLRMPVMPLFAAIAVAGVIVLVPFWLIETLAVEAMPLSWSAVFSIVGVAVFASVLAFSTYQQGIRIVGSNRGGPFMYLMPVFAALMAVVFLGESLEVYHVLGFAMVVPGVAAATLRY